MNDTPVAWKGKRDAQMKDWEVRRAQFLAGKRCEWCGSESGLVVATRTLAPTYISQLKDASAKLLKERIEAGEYAEIEEELAVCPQCGNASLAERRVKKPTFKCRNCRAEFDLPIKRIIKTGRISPEDWKSFWGKYSPSIKDKIIAERAEAEKRHMELVDCIALCKRCHFARQKGLLLCPACKKAYRRAGNELCWECFKKTEKGKEVAKMYEMVAYEHPWCLRKFGVERRFMELLNDPAVCCRELCMEFPTCRIVSERVSV